MNSSTVSAELGFRLVIPPQTIVPLVAKLHYSSDDPYEIRIAFHVGLHEPVEWIFARDLLADGLKSRVGHGDITVWPSPSAKADQSKRLWGLIFQKDSSPPLDVLNIELSSPFGQAHFEVAANEISDFLNRTYQAVPPDAESSHMDVDAELTAFLRES